VTAIGWNENGKRNFQNCRLRESGGYIEHQTSNIKHRSVATFISNNPAETEAIGQRFAKDLDAGSVLALKGELGSGKTQFVKGLVAGLESSAAVTSRRLIPARIFERAFPVYHLFFASKIDNRSRGLASMITFSATAFR
jgi:hypothetical protein